MKRTLLLAAAALCFSATAYAGEGNGDPFPVRNPGVTTQVPSPKYTMGAAAPFNYFSSGVTSPVRSPNYTMGAAAPFNYFTPGRPTNQRPAAPGRASVAVSPGAQPGTHG